MRPCSTLKNCGSSSSEVRRIKRPTGVMRESLRLACCTCLSSCTCMERNFHTLMTLPFQPLRFCLNSTGPLDVNLIAAATASSTGLKPIIANSARVRSSRALLMAAVG
ncbi:hypothetical protein D9M71_733290 [compost metagenome]